MSAIRKGVKSELLAVSIFSFLTGICLALIFSKSLSYIKDYVEIFSYQLDNVDLDYEKIFISVIINRLIILVFIFFCSNFYHGKYCLHVFASVFFMLYGLFLVLNVVALGLKGMVTGFLLLIPHWTIYLLGFVVCIKTNRINNRRLIDYIVKISPIILILLGAILETYVTQPLIFKII